MGGRSSKLSHGVSTLTLDKQKYRSTLSLSPDEWNLIIKDSFKPESVGLPSLKPQMRYVGFPSHQYHLLSERPHSEEERLQRISGIIPIIEPNKPTILQSSLNVEKQTSGSPGKSLTGSELDTLKYLESALAGDNDSSYSVVSPGRAETRPEVLPEEPLSVHFTDSEDENEQEISTTYSPAKEPSSPDHLSTHTETSHITMMDDMPIAYSKSERGSPKSVVTIETTFKAQSAVGSSSKEENSRNDEGLTDQFKSRQVAYVKPNNVHTPSISPAKFPGISETHIGKPTRYESPIQSTKKVSPMHSERSTIGTQPVNYRNSIAIPDYSTSMSTDFRTTSPPSQQINFVYKQGSRQKSLIQHYASTESEPSSPEKPKYTKNPSPTKSITETRINPKEDKASVKNMVQRFESFGSPGTRPKSWAAF